MSHTQRYFIELAYEGTAYHGWQIQENAVSVQEILNKALSTVWRQSIETVGCGRTDTGVHARQFYAHFDVVEVGESGSPKVGKSESREVGKLESREAEKPDLESTTDNLPPTTYNLQPITYYRQLIVSLNALLPYDIAVKRIIEVAPDAHARFDATSRSYEYHIHFTKDPFRQGFSWLMRDEPDITLMNRAAQVLLEYRDFSCFSKSNTQTFTNNCRICRAEWIRTPEGLVFYITADRFLRNMVRAIVGTLIQVGRAEILPEEIRNIVISKNRSNAGASVPACGLFLTEIKYPYLHN